MRAGVTIIASHSLPQGNHQDSQSDASDDGRFTITWLIARVHPATWPGYRVIPRPAGSSIQIASDSNNQGRALGHRLCR